MAARGSGTLDEVERTTDGAKPSSEETSGLDGSLTQVEALVIGMTDWEAELCTGW